MLRSHQRLISWKDFLNTNRYIKKLQSSKTAPNMHATKKAFKMIQENAQTNRQTASLLYSHGLEAKKQQNLSPPPALALFWEESLNLSREGSS